MLLGVSCVYCMLWGFYVFMGCIVYVLCYFIGGDVFLIVNDATHDIKYGFFLPRERTSIVHEADGYDSFPWVLFQKVSDAFIWDAC